MSGRTSVRTHAPVPVLTVRGIHAEERRLRADPAVLVGAADKNPAVLVGVAELYRRLAQDGPPVLLDVRPGPEGGQAYRAGHLPGAVNADLTHELSWPPAADARSVPDPAAVQAAARRLGLTRKRGVVVYDDGAGRAAATAWWLLRWAGLDNTRILAGGWPAWAAAGHGRAVGTARPQPPSEIILDGGSVPPASVPVAAALARGDRWFD